MILFHGAFLLCILFLALSICHPMTRLEHPATLQQAVDAYPHLGPFTQPSSQSPSSKDKLREQQLWFLKHSTSHGDHSSVLPHGSANSDGSHSELPTSYHRYSPDQSSTPARNRDTLDSSKAALYSQLMRSRTRSHDLQLFGVAQFHDACHGIAERFRHAFGCHTGPQLDPTTRARFRRELARAVVGAVGEKAVQPRVRDIARAHGAESASHGGRAPAKTPNHPLVLRYEEMRSSRRSRERDSSGRVGVGQQPRRALAESESSRSVAESSRSGRTFKAHFGHDLASSRKST